MRLINAPSYRMRHSPSRITRRFSATFDAEAFGHDGRGLQVVNDNRPRLTRSAINKAKHLHLALKSSGRQPAHFSDQDFQRVGLLQKPRAGGNVVRTGSALS